MLARSHEKGFHNLVSAFIALRQREGAPNVKLRFAGWLGAKHHDYLKQELKRLDSAGLSDAYEHVQCPDHASKVRFFNSIDVLCVPTEYREPKGLYVLESWANHVPVVLPDHGCFSELVFHSEAGLLVPPGDSEALATALLELLHDQERRELFAESMAIEL